MIGITVSQFNKPITEGLLNGCLKSLKENGFNADQIDIFYVPGVFELPAKVKHLAKKISIIV